MDLIEYWVVGKILFVIFLGLEFCFWFLHRVFEIISWKSYLYHLTVKEGSSGDKGEVKPSEGGTDEKELEPAEKSLLQKVIRKGLVENKNDLEIQRKDPKSPLYSVKSFEALNLKPQLLKGVYGMGFNAPSKIQVRWELLQDYKLMLIIRIFFLYALHFFQETALPTLLADPPQNMIAQSQSGTGKTAAFVLAMLSRVDVSKQYPQVSTVDFF